jgi:eukaryotic-like serine/threonine-protein kinase
MNEPTKTSTDVPSPEKTNPGTVGLDTIPSIVSPPAKAHAAKPEPELNLAFGPAQKPDEVGTLGPYRILKLLGRGGMGAVYLAVDERLKRKIAFKVMLPKYANLPSAKARFLREARAAAGLSHDHIVTIYEADERDGIPYMAMQYLQGMPLDEYIETNGSLDLSHVLRISREIALGLSAAHDIGLIHRDIKPANIWLEAPKGRVKILDFGLAKPSDEDDSGVEQTATGVVLGTPAYMPPEQAAGSKVDFRADLFSLGVVLYRLATGHAPFQGPNVMAVLAAVLTEDPIPANVRNPALPEPLVKLIHQLLNKQPEKRPNSAAEVAERLQQIQAGTAAGTNAVPQAIPLTAFPTMARSTGAEAFADINLTDPEQIVTTRSGTPKKKKKKAKPFPKWLLYISAGMLIPFLGFLLFLALWTPKGTLIVEAADADVEITIKKDGKVLVEKSLEREFRLNAGEGYQIEMNAKPGQRLSTNSFGINKSEKSLVRVIADKPKPPPIPPVVVPKPQEADRMAAQWVLDNWGMIGINGKAATQLPSEPFELTKVAFYKRPEITDEGLEVFKGCKRLREIELRELPNITDKGLANFALVARHHRSNSTIIPLSFRHQEGSSCVRSRSSSCSSSC